MCLFLIAGHTHPRAHGYCTVSYKRRASAADVVECAAAPSYPAEAMAMCVCWTVVALEGLHSKSPYFQTLQTNAK